MPHTPGPWQYREETCEIIAPNAPRYPEDPEDDSVICVAYLRGAMGGNDCVADRNLIAAAPELLEACRLLMRAEPMQQGERNGAIMGRISTAIDAARAALEKATGESR